MELMIYSPAENERLPEIQWNFEEIKKYAAEKAAWYQSIAYTDADTKEMKNDKARSFPTEWSGQRQTCKERQN